MTQLELALNYLEQHESEMLALWEDIVRLESPSTDAAAVAQVGKYIDDYCTGLGLEAELHESGNAGPSLSAKTKAGSLPPLLFLAHTDTVHPIGSFAAGPWVVKEDGFAYGPGIYDCKGGIAIALFVMQALLHAGYDKRQLKLALASDEEAAHTLSKGKVVEYLKEQARGCGAAFTMESGPMTGDVITRRKGGGITKMTVKGIASHAGTDPEKGASAIWAAAQKIVEIQALSDPNHVTYNCGIIQGGTSANVVPDHCEVSVAIRYITNQDCVEAMEKLNAICATEHVKGTSASLGPLVGYSAMEEQEKTGELFQLYVRASESLGLGTPKPIFSGGCSDSAYTTALGVPTLDALGVLGEGAHTVNERALVSSMLTQAKRLAATILSLPDTF